ncbi:hypothetical protein K435DRAFT_761640 [Dendrothele bispora CBS 962.96]|uniref:Xylanolytic transcriptional activator regulatory domain-containing protein n=1 Tax=Dendrothele bispora (strain CBS 962.96) TaxID=1314807 RepID=A0A4S8LHY9_DENBC|nr:hypothetical protein K435DRAFT_761640 [Dendrothele bispora CBS 962.96]
MSSPTKRPEDPQRKRRKGATRLSCAECRRLKLRYLHHHSLYSCVKRGCGAICPDGSLTTGQGNRFVLASTQELHEKIHELANRVRELEDALRTDHTQLTNEQHPLLSDELLKIKAPLQRDIHSLRPNPDSQKEDEHNPDVVDAFGSLSISLSGKTKFYGQIANSWYFLQNEAGDDDETTNHLSNLQSILHPQVLHGAAALPISPTVQSDPVSLQTLFWYLPDAARAAELQSIYYRHAAWMYNPVSQDIFEYEVYSQFYDPNSNRSSDDPILLHRLSLMFMVLAIGSLMDPSLPPYNIEAEKFHQLAKAALFKESFLDAPTINSVQALFLMSYYLFLSDRHGNNSGARWAINGLAVKLAQSIGLHRDSGRWNGVETDETQRRRQLFWELFTYDSWQSLTFGRPPSFALPHVDCKMPHANELGQDQIFHAWKHRFVSECMNLLHDQAFGAKTPSYATVLQLDRKLRAFTVPSVLQVAGFGNSDSRPVDHQESIMLTLQRHIVLAIREMDLLYLHRSFFARAISDHPKDPLGSPYGTSVIAAYRSAGSLVALMRNLHTQLKEPSERLWFLWTHMFSCAIILGSIVTRCPSMSLAPSALVQLDSACELFGKASGNFRAGKVLEIMQRLQVRAHESLESYRKGLKIVPARHGSSSEPPTPVDDNDELAVLGGKTRLVKKEPGSPTLLDRSPISQNPVIPLPLSPTTAQVDPNVLEYLNSFHHQQQPSSAGTSNYSDVSPVSVYGLTALSGPSSPFHTEPNSFISQSQPMTSPQSMVPQNSSSHHHQSSVQYSQNVINGHGHNNSFPQYFPVYDYGTTSMMNGYAPTLDANPTPGHGHRRSSGSPEQNMIPSTWQEFVDDMSM